MQKKKQAAISKFMNVNLCGGAPYGRHFVASPPPHKVGESDYYL